MHLRFFLTFLAISFLLNLYKVDAIPTKNKSTSSSQTAGINSKRGVTAPSVNGSSSKPDAGGMAVQLLKDYNAKQKEEGSSIETPPASPTVPVSPVLPALPAEDDNITKLKDQVAQVKSSLEAFENAVKSDDSIWGEIEKKQVPEVEQLLQQLSSEIDPKDMMSAMETFSKLVNAVKSMAATVVEQNDDGRLHGFLSSLNNALQALQTGLESYSSPNTGSDATPGADLNGLTGAIDGDQEA